MTAFQDESINLIDKYHLKSREPNFHLRSRSSSASSWPPGGLPGVMVKLCVSEKKCMNDNSE